MARYRIRQLCIAGVLVASRAGAAHAVFPASAVRRCGPDAVVAGTVCLDKYEASVWRVPNPTTSNAILVKRIQLGTASRDELMAAGAQRLGDAFDNYLPCTDTGQSCANDIYAVSLPSEIPSSHITWFQAQEACANAGKRLPTNAIVVKRIQLGTASRDELTAAGAQRLGEAFDNYLPCRDTGQSCANDIYAVSLPSEIPSSHISWFQAQEACANAGKRLPTNAEWQVGVNGTPDPGPDNGTTDCNSNSGVASLTGSRRDCVSARGAFDMVGNLAEWVADWVPASTTCLNWASFSDDDMCLAGASESIAGPGALLRGGWFTSGAGAGPLSIQGSSKPIRSLDLIGFRCAR